MNELIVWSEGNPGAMDFLMKVFLTDEATPIQAMIIASKVKSYTTLRGTNLYVLYSDLCNRNIEKVVKLLKECPQDIVEDACSRQDYSGRELVKEYLED